ncbi:hypothetical protein PG993_012997 [Apiospora rasikravindrae]|uniref:Uncharacterized protein n=1 Tax=Apiospora rasikravindrae TaxID=990691 RepID=A0ABR1RWD6_9PEZI
MQRHHIFRVWAWEIIFVVLAFGLITSIAALLTLNNGKPVPDWGSHISFNALLAVLSTVLRATLVITVSSIISQRKWEWYGEGRPRPLSDLQQFDAGSRGILGAILLVPTIIRRDAVALAAIIILLASFLIGPFVQQASHTEECWFAVPDTDASLPYAHYVPRLLAGSSAESIPNPGQELYSLILSAAMAPDGPGNQISATCTTGNCTFSGEDQRGAQNKTHSTVGMCNKCVDISSLACVDEQNTLQLKNVPKEYNISGHEDAAVMRSTPDLVWLGDLFTPELRAVSRWAYINSTFIAKDKSGEMAVAAVCSLYPCLRTHNASITHNQLSESEIRSEPLRINIPGGSTSKSHAALSGSSLENTEYHYVAVMSPCHKNNGTIIKLPPNTTFHPAVTELALYDFTDYGGLAPYHPTGQNITAPEECIYRHNAEFAAFISEPFKRFIFYGSCDYISDGGLACAADLNGKLPSFDMLPSAGDWGVLSALYNNGDAAFPTTARWFDAFANAMTNHLRSRYGAGAFDSSNPEFTLDLKANVTLHPGEVLGKTWQTTVCVSMRKEWLLLPVGLTVITALLTSWTIVTSWRHRYTRPVWKDSILPLMFNSHIIETTARPHEKAEAATEAPTSRHHQTPLPNDDGDDGDFIDYDSRGGEGADDHGADTSDSKGDRLGLYGGGRLLEASEMKVLGDRVPVTFRWPASGEDEKGGVEEGDPGVVNKAMPPLRLRKGLMWKRLQNKPDVDVDSLLETGE